MLVALQGAHASNFVLMDVIIEHAVLPHLVQHDQRRAGGVVLQPGDELHRGVSEGGADVGAGVYFS